MIERAPSRILIYVNRVGLDEISGQGGFERMVFAGLREIVAGDHGLEVEVICPLGKSTDNDESGRRMRVYGVAFTTKSLWGGLIYEIKTGARLLRLVRRHRKANVAIYARYSTGMFMAAAVAWKCSVPLVVRCGPLGPGLRRRGEDRRWVHWVADRLLRFTLQRARTVLVATSTIGDWIRRAYPDLDVPIVVRPNGIELGDQDARPARGNDSLMRFGFVGTINSSNYLIPVVEAVRLIAQRRKAQDFEIIVVGDGPEAARCRERAAELQVDHLIAFRGWQSVADTRRILSSCDVGLLPVSAQSLEIRGCSAMKLFEYLAADMPVVAPRAPDLLFLETEGLGVLAKADDATDWARAMESLLDSGRRGLAGRGVEVVTTRFSARAVAEAIVGAALA